MKINITRWLMLVMAPMLVMATHNAMAGKDEETRSTLEDQKKVAVTIYNQQLALVKDLREITLQKGLNILAFREVSGQIRPETALLRSLSHPQGFSLLEQNFDFDLLTPEKLLQKFVGQKVRVVKTHPTTGAESSETALVLSANNGVVLKIGDRIETGIPGRIVYDEVPANLRDRPTLVLQLQTATSRPQQLELSYLTGGLSWRADYVAELNNDDSRLDLNGWVTLTNQSGTSYPNAQLQLVAGDVNRVRDEMKQARRSVPMAAMSMESGAADMVEEGLFEYHLYTLNRLTTIANNQTKQVALLSAQAVPVKKQFLLKGQNYYYQSSYGDLGQKIKIGVYVEFQNSEKANLGMPLPKGIVRVYKKDSKGNAQFVGEDRIDHTPKNEEVKLKLGDAFDVTANKKQVDFKKLTAFGKYRYAAESAYEIVFKNAKPEAVVVTVQEPVPGEWKIVSESHKHSKEAAGTAVWQVKVPPEGEATLSYRVEVRF